MLWKIALTIVLLWFLAGVIGAIFRSFKMRVRLFTGLCAFSAAALAYICGWGELLSDVMNGSLLREYPRDTTRLMSTLRAFPGNETYQEF
ncbi:MAG: hypothetical protein WAM76_15680 [Pseudolabrys sp.]